ncbi:DUF3618 domain-containing protein [Sphingomonas profundi]|uniref:DUF3618 domain-containing protein n=1 Tax=Alterirhizorhabdus profundi TaxID=2681549 RepID=UPI0012E91961|nr:DUF3618 domain-containing protein [Sphingomonas profundi]
MSGKPADIARAKAEAAAARIRIDETVARLKVRLSPRVRVRETWEDVREKGEEMGDTAVGFAIERPGTVAAVAGAGTLLLLRRPLWRLLRRLAFWRRPKWDAEPSNTPAATTRRRRGKGGERR